MFFEPYEFRLSTLFDTHIYVVLIGDEPVHYILRHNPDSGEPLNDVLIASSRFVSPEDSFTGHVYVASPFNSEIFLYFENGEIVNFRGLYRTPSVDGNVPANYVPQNLYNREELSRTTGAFNTSIPFSPTYHHIVPSSRINPVVVMGALTAVAIGLVFYLAIKNASNKCRKEKARDEWNEKFNKIKIDAEQARMDRGYKPDKFN